MTFLQGGLGEAVGDGGGDGGGAGVGTAITKTSPSNTPFLVATIDIPRGGSAKVNVEWTAVAADGLNGYSGREWVQARAPILASVLDSSASGIEEASQFSPGWNTGPAAAKPSVYFATTAASSIAIYAKGKAAVSISWTFVVSSVAAGAT